MAGQIVSNSWSSNNSDFQVKVSDDGGTKVQHVNVDSMPGITISGGATEAKQDTQITALGTLATEATAATLATESTLSTLNGKVTACNTGAVVVSSSALPSGAATAANQSTGNASLSSIDGKITTCDTSSIAGTIEVLKISLTADTPNNATVTGTSAAILAANANRKGSVFTNLSSDTIFFGIGVAAQVNKGISLYPQGVWVMDIYTFSTAEIRAISSGSSSVVAIQEFS